MLHRSLDVTFQYLAWLVAALLLVPSVVLTIGLAVDRTQMVTARLWADTPAVLADSPYAQPTNGLTAANRATDLLTELLQTDSFIDAVIREAKLDGKADPVAIGNDLRKGLYVGSEGPHVVVLMYGTSRPDRGLTLVKAVVAAFQRAQQSVQEGQISIADEALSSQLRDARKEMDDAIAAAQQYRAAHGPDTLVGTDATYQSLRQFANLKIENFSNLQEQADKATQYGSAIPAVQPGVLSILDQPEVAPWQLKLRGNETKNALLALLAILALEIIFVYNVTRRDQRVRTTSEVIATLGLRPLGSVPHPHPHGKSRSAREPA